MTERVNLEPGQPAPEFSLLDQHGETRSLADYRGRRVILFVYPAAMTPGCTTEACDFRDSIAPLRDAGYDVLGLSPDPVDKLAAFAERDALDYPLLSDPDHRTITAYGAYGEKKNYGRTYEGVIRSTFVIDESGRIAHALVNVKATGHVARILKTLDITPA